MYLLRRIIRRRIFLNLIENFFAKLKQYGAIATRYDKTAHNFLGAIYMASIVIWLN
jgi:transposase